MGRISTPLPSPPHPLSSTHERWCLQPEGKFQEKHKKASVYLWRTIILNFACKISNFTTFSWFCSTKESIFSIHQEFLSHLKEISLFFFCYLFYWFLPLSYWETLLTFIPHSTHSTHTSAFQQRTPHLSFGLYPTPTKRHSKLLLFSRRSKSKRINSSMSEETSEKQDIFFNMYTF